MDIITLTPENLEKEHICCAISNNNDCQVASKKSWLSDRFADGLVFKKADFRGKCFIEYIPAEKAWVPICADGYMYIDCLWVAGSLKGQGYSTLLLDECIRDSREKGKLGLVILSAPKKMPFMSDPGFLKHKGFEVVDTAEPYYTLMYLPFEENTEKPKFRERVKRPHTDGSGFELFYTNQCPYTAKYVPLIEAVANERGVEFKSVRFESAEQAQNAPAPFTTYSMFYNGKFLTNEIMSEKKFAQVIDEKTK